MTNPENPAEEQYMMTARSLRDLFNGIGDEEDLSIVCQAAAVRVEDVLTQSEIETIHWERENA